MELDQENSDSVQQANKKPVKARTRGRRRSNRPRKPNPNRRSGGERKRRPKVMGPPPVGLNLENCRRVAWERFGIEKLHPEQEAALESLISGQDTLVVLPTGYGKSLIYQILAVLAEGPVITLFPLIALMRDQERSLDEDAVPVVRLDSTLTVKARREALERVRQGGQLVILTTPETLTTADLQNALKGQTPALLCVDEAHCISEWGHDFRPAYLRVGIERNALGRPTVLGLTATATPRVRQDIAERMQMEDPTIIAVPPQRDNLRLAVRNVPGNLKVAAAGKLLRQLRRPGIVYCATTKTVDEVYVALRRARIPAVRYHGRMTKAERTAAQERYTKHGPRIVMVATSAFGMGIDKRDIRYILHLQVPGSIEQYIQEAGRAGRDGRTSHCILLYDESDLDIQRRLNATGQANMSQLYSIGDALAAWADVDRTVAVKDLALSAQVPLTACRALCNQLEEAQLIVRDSQAKIRVLVDTETLAATVDELTRRFATKHREDTRRLSAIADYATSPECRSAFVRKWFGEDDPPKCGQCDRCRPKPPPVKQSATARDQEKSGKDKTKRRRRRPSRRRGQGNNRPNGEKTSHDNNNGNNSSDKNTAAPRRRRRRRRGGVQRGDIESTNSGVSNVNTSDQD